MVLLRSLLLSLLVHYSDSTRRQRPLVTRSSPACGPRPAIRAPAAALAPAEIVRRAARPSGASGHTAGLSPAAPLKGVTSTSGARLTSSCLSLPPCAYFLSRL